MRDLAAEIRSIDLWAWCSAFLRWWLSELANLLPPIILRLVRARSARILVEAIHDQIIIRRYSSNGYSELLRLHRDEIARGQRLPSVAAAGREMSEPVVLHLPTVAALRKRVDLPAAATGSLRQILDFEIDRQSPLDRDRIYYDYVVQQRDRRAKRVTVELRILRRDDVDHALSACQTLGLRPAMINLPGEDRPFPLDSAAKSAGADARRWQRHALSAALAACAVALLVTAVLVNWYHKREIADAVEQRLIQAKDRARTIDNLRKEVATLEKRTELLPRQKAGSLVVKILDETTRRLPDHSWLTDFEVHGGEVRIRGFSAAATELVSRFDASPIFVNTRFRAALTQASRAGFERFDLSFDLKEARP